jgi:hypothetical protein
MRDAWRTSADGCALRTGSVHFLKCGEDFIERGFVLQLAEVGRVGRADVDDEEIRVRPEEAERAGVILGGGLERGDFGFAEVDADGMRGPAPQRAPVRELLREGFGAGIVEAHAVDERFVGDGAEHARGGIAGLRVPGDAAEFTEAEPERGPDGRGGGVFVHARGEPDGVAELQAEGFDGKLRRAEEGVERIAQGRVTAGPAEGGEGAVVDFLGLMGEQRGPDDGTVEPRHAATIPGDSSLVNRENGIAASWSGRPPGVGSGFAKQSA